MQLPPLILLDISFLFAIGAIVLLIITELSSSYYGQTTLIINRHKLKNATYIVALLFLISAAIILIQLLSS